VPLPLRPEVAQEFRPRERAPLEQELERSLAQAVKPALPMEAAAQPLFESGPQPVRLPLHCHRCPRSAVAQVLPPQRLQVVKPRAGPGRRSAVAPDLLRLRPVRPQVPAQSRPREPATRADLPHCWASARAQHSRPGLMQRDWPRSGRYPCCHYRRQPANQPMR
jgi:hypothetical protein